MNTYMIDGMEIDSVELKCLVVSRGVKVDKAIYRRFSKSCRLNISPLTCNCILLSDGTIMQMTDLAFHLKMLSGMLSWDNLKLLRYISDLGTPFTLELQDEKPVLCYNRIPLDTVSFPPYTDFYRQRTAVGTPFIGNAVLQGLDWVAFQCLWHCQYAVAGKPCEFCFSGADFESRAEKGKPQRKALRAEDVAEIVGYAMQKVNCNSVQITGGSTFGGTAEAHHIMSYLEAIAENEGAQRVTGEILLYITPPGDKGLIDSYFSMGAGRIACSLEVWAEERAKIITPGKIQYTTRKRHLDVLEYIVQKYGPGKAFSNFIIGLEPFETLAEGAEHLASRGIIPTASIWMPMGRPVMNSMKAQDVDFYRSVKELFAELYQRYNLEPAGCCGLNVCMERDIWRFSNS